MGEQKLYEYKGQMLSQAAIARIEGVSRQRIHQRINNRNTPLTLDDAGLKRRVGGARTRRRLMYEYKGERLHIDAIAAREGVTVNALRYRMKKFGTTEKMPWGSPSRTG